MKAHKANDNKDGATGATKRNNKRSKLNALFSRKRRISGLWRGQSVNFSKMAGEGGAIAYQSVLSDTSMSPTVAVHRRH